MSKLTLVQFDADSTTMAGQYAFQERGDDGSFIALFDVDGEQIASRNSFPKASWSAVKELGEMNGDDSEDFWNLIGNVKWCKDHLEHLSEHIPAMGDSEYCDYCAKNTKPLLMKKLRHTLVKNGDKQNDND